MVKVFLFIFCLFSINSASVFAKSAYPGYVDAAAKQLYGSSASFSFSCAGCHGNNFDIVNNGNPFGQAVLATALQNNLDTTRMNSTEIAMIVEFMQDMDPDKDGATNKEEMMAGTHPGDASSVPAPVVVVNPCVHAAPSISLSTAKQAADAGGQLDYKINFKNNDSAECAMSTIELSANLPAELAGQLSVQSLVLAPGASGSSTLSLSTAANLAAGDYAFSVMALDTDGSGKQASTSGIYTVNEPAVVVNPCVHAAPSISLSTAKQAADAGGTLDYSINFKNNDSAECPMSAIELSASLPAELIGQLSVQSLVLAPGASGSSVLSLTSAANLAAGDYAFSVMALDTDGSGKQASTSGIYTVNEPAPVPVCVQAQPVLTISPATQSALAGASLVYNLSLSNKDSKECTTSTFNLNANLPAVLSGQLSMPNVSLIPGETKDFSIAVSSDNAANAGVYSFDVIAQNSAVSSQMVQASANYQVMGALDTTAPSIPADLSYQQIKNKFILSWSPSVDDSEVAKYKIYIDGVLKAESVNTQASIRLSWGGHEIQIEAQDSSGNISDKSAVLLINKVKPQRGKRK